jgi:exodeoxyribonuclease-3
MGYAVPRVGDSLWLLSWNVNGLRAVLRKGAFSFLRRQDVDILCLQETRTAAEQVLEDPARPLFPDLPHQYFNPAEKPGYAGTAVFSALEPLTVRCGMGRAEHDREGRLLTLEFERFFLVNVYVPNAQRGLLRLDYRLRWDRDLRLYLKGLDRRKPVVFCGDLNVAHQEIDLARPGDNHENAGFTDQEREGFGRLLGSGFLDSFRDRHPGEGGHYTWWSMPTRARERNVGWRIDYFCLSRRLAPALKEAFILPAVEGSDHCPVGIRLSW